MSLVDVSSTIFVGGSMILRVSVLKLQDFTARDNVDDPCIAGTPFIHSILGIRVFRGLGFRVP